MLDQSKFYLVENMELEKVDLNSFKFISKEEVERGESGLLLPESLDIQECEIYRNKKVKNCAVVYNPKEDGVWCITEKYINFCTVNEGTTDQYRKIDDTEFENMCKDLIGEKEYNNLFRGNKKMDEKEKLDAMFASDNSDKNKLDAMFGAGGNDLPKSNAGFDGNGESGEPKETPKTEGSVNIPAFMNNMSYNKIKMFNKTYGSLVCLVARDEDFDKFALKTWYPQDETKYPDTAGYMPKADASSQDLQAWKDKSGKKAPTKKLFISKLAPTFVEKAPGKVQGAIVRLPKETFLNSQVIASNNLDAVKIDKITSVEPKEFITIPLKDDILVSTIITLFDDLMIREEFQVKSAIKSGKTDADWSETTGNNYIRVNATERKDKNGDVKQSVSLKCTNGRSTLFTDKNHIAAKQYDCYEVDLSKAMSEEVKENIKNWEVIPELNRALTGTKTDDNQAGVAKKTELQRRNANAPEIVEFVNGEIQFPMFEEGAGKAQIQVEPWLRKTVNATYVSKLKFRKKVTKDDGKVSIATAFNFGAEGYDMARYKHIFESELGVKPEMIAKIVATSGGGNSKKKDVEDKVIANILQPSITEVGGAANADAMNKYFMNLQKNEFLSMNAGGSSLLK